MFKDKRLTQNTALLTGASLAMRFAAMIWQVWLAARIGEAGIGLFQLILSVGGLAATFAVSGIRFTATRLVSEELGSGRPHGSAAAMSACLGYGALFGTAAMTILLLLSRPLGFLWLGDARTVLPLRLLGLSLPFLALSTVIFGYFTATGRVWKSVSVQIGRELLMMGVTLLLLLGYRRGNLEQACVCITAGSAIADAVSFLVLYAVYIRDRKRHGIVGSGCRTLRIGNRMLSIALPLALTSYARSGLSTLQHLLVPKGLRSSGLTAADALAGYGVIQGMALPVVLFPSCLMLSIAELIVPKLTEAQVRKQQADIRSVTGDLMHKSLIFTAGIAFMFLLLGDRFGKLLYDSAEAGHYIQLFALIVPVMYLDMIADGCLKGLGEMMFCMYVNIIDAGLSALLVWLLLPRWGLAAYIFVICFTEAFNFVLSLWRLGKISACRLSWKRSAHTLFSAAIAASAARSLDIIISAGNGVPALVVSLVFGCLIYMALINLPGPVKLSPEEEAGRPASW